MKRPKELDGCSRKYVAGVYQIKNNLNGKFYIGSSTHLYRRFSDHVRELQRGTHSNPKLQNSWLKFGADAFEFGILEFCNPDKIFELEQKYIDRLNPFYNIAREVGVPNTPKSGTIEAMIRSQKSMEARKKSSWINSDKFHSMLSRIMKNRWKNPEYKELRSSNAKELWNDPRYRNKQYKSKCKLTLEQKQELIQMKSEGYSSSYLIKKFEISNASLSRICRGLQ